MQFIKLQIGCLLVISYIEVTYIKATLKGKIPCNKRFDLLMAVAPWAVFFDGLTAWTVNHQDVIPGFVYVNLLLEKMRDDRYYRNILNKDYMLNVIHAAPLHDIGKIATPDSILQKPGKLTAAEYEIMKQHAATGGDIILQTFYNLDDADFRQIAYEVARFHHEKFNGNH